MLEIKDDEVTLVVQALYDKAKGDREAAKSCAGANLKQMSDALIEQAYKCEEIAERLEGEGY